MDLKKTNQEKAAELFARKKTMIANIKKNQESQPKKIKIEPKYGAPNLHSFNNYGEKFDEINTKQGNINSVFLTLTDEQKKIIHETVFVALDHNSDLDIL